MTKFEYVVNGGKLSTNIINCIINDLNGDTSFDAWINAKSISEVCQKLPKDYELDISSTLQNYFSHEAINKFEIELVNSQYIYFHDFDKLYEYGFNMYVKALEKEDYKETERLDRQHQT
jgi:hypothetical protein